MTDTSLGFIGLGLMGLPMTLRLVHAGRRVTVWNRSAEKVKPALEAGAREAESPAAVAGNAEVVFLCLTDTAAVEEVVFGANGLAGAGGNARIVVDFSSIRPDRTREMAERLKQEANMEWVDAPVSGGVKGARDGTLAIMAGGEARAVAQVGTLIEPLCNRFTHMGPVGAGQVTKLCNQAIVSCNLAVLAEAVNLARRAGVDAGKLPEALKGGFADSIPLQLFVPRMVNRIFEPPVGHASTMKKDVDTIRDLARETGSDVPMVDRAEEIFRRLIEAGHGDHDVATIIELFDEPES